MFRQLVSMAAILIAAAQFGLLSGTAVVAFPLEAPASAELSQKLRRCANPLDPVSRSFFLFRTASTDYPLRAPAPAIHRTAVAVPY
ncbi:hypothetical protein PM082_023920 [Marasmius tenuissimus]|nr:hypothetical protein PM082_023920 [Marasmius tenuissimus]